MFELDAQEAGDLVVIVHTIDGDDAAQAKASLDAIGCGAVVEEIKAGRVRGWLVRVPRMLRVPAAVLTAMNRDEEAFARLGEEPIDRRLRLFTDALTWNAVSEGQFAETLGDPRVRSWARASLGLDEEEIAQAYRDAERGFASRNTWTVAFAGVLGVAGLSAGIATGLGGWGFDGFPTIGLLVFGAISMGAATVMVVQSR